MTGKNLVKPDRITTRLVELSSMIIHGLLAKWHSFLFYGKTLWNGHKRRRLSTVDLKSRCHDQTKVPG